MARERTDQAAVEAHAVVQMGVSAPTQGASVLGPHKAVAVAREQTSGATRRARAIMLVGTSSGVGKSVLCTALCRIFTQDGLRVAPFKAQNMSLNSAATPSGREIGRAQAVQAEACGLYPNEHMNPILLKPSGATRSQVVVQGRVYDTQSAREYFLQSKDELWAAVVESYQYLADRFEVLVIEGAGSPVELNLKPRDIANMRVAELADAAVVLVADIDRGGVFASVVGTLQLLEPHERARVKGIIVNRFRGDPSLFIDGVRLLEERAGVPVIGVVPYLPDLGIEEEDSVALDSARYHGPTGGTDMAATGAVQASVGWATSTSSGAPAKCGEDAVRIAIVQLPHLANFTDFDPLFLEPGVCAYFCRRPEELQRPHAVILPGTKNTIGDLRWLGEVGWMPVLLAHLAAGGFLLGICGGYQMLGREVRDPDGHESEVPAWPGLGVFDSVTTIAGEKRTVLVQGHLCEDPGVPLEGYEIHMGVTEHRGPLAPFARVRAAGDAAWTEDGAVVDNGRVVGTYLHGLFDNDRFRERWLNQIRRRTGLTERKGSIQLRTMRVKALDRLAAVVRAHVDVPQIYGWLGLPGKRG